MKKKEKEATKFPKNIFSRQDILIFVSLAIIGSIITLAIYSPAESLGSAKKRLEVRQNETLIMSLPLDEDTTRQIKGEHDNLNTFTIKKGIVQMKQANCHDSTCIKTGAISKAGETIVCLPHRLVLKITTDVSDTQPDNNVDAIVQ